MKKNQGKIVAALGIVVLAAGLGAAVAHDQHNRFECDTRGAARCARDALGFDAGRRQISSGDR